MAGPKDASWSGISPTATNLDDSTFGQGTTTERNNITSWPATRPFFDTDDNVWYYNSHVSAPSSVTWSNISPPAVRTRKVDTLSSDANTTSGGFQDSGLTLTLANISGGFAIVTATMSVRASVAADEMDFRILHDSTAVDTQRIIAGDVGGLLIVHLSAVVSLDGNVVKVQFRRGTGTGTTTIDFISGVAVPKLELLEVSG